MKKLLLILSIFVVSLSAFAADLNPFAYELRSSVNASNPMQLDIQFSINAPATSVKVYLYEIDGDWEVEVDAHLTVDNRAYEGWIDLSVVPGNLRGGENNINWRVDVKGAAVASPTPLDNSKRKLYSPTSIDIDNNPENENFGTVFVVEGKPDAKDNATYSSYLSYKDGAGLYLFNADGTARPMPNRPAGKYGYNGGRVQQARQYFNGNASGGYSPYRVRVSDDGRIFISSMTPDGEVLWEADPLVFSRPDAADWEARAVAGWSRVMSSKNANTVMGTAKRNCSHADCGIYHLYQNDAGGPFIAGPNMGFDVRGSGKDLQLLMLAGCKQAIVHTTPAHFYCDEYDLGIATMWNTPPSRRIFAGYVFNYAGVQVQYDGDGNVWLCQHRSGTDAAETLMKFDVNNLGAPWKEDPKKPYHRCGAIRFNNDYTQVAIATIGSGEGGAFTVYPVENGMPVWNQGTEVDCKSVTHHSLMDFAWDYAGNLYIAADAASGNAGHCVAIYAMPHAADKVVSTPAATGYAFSISCTAGEYYNVEVVSSNSNYGTVEGGGTVASCEDVEVFAQSKEDYKFVCWKEGDNVVSSQNPYKFPVTKNITLTAHFEAGDYTVTWWNLFKGGEDITALSTDNSYNARFWRLYQVELNAFDVVRSDFKHTPSGKSRRFNVGEFLNTRFSHSMQLIEGDPHSDSNKENKGMFTWLRDYLTYMNGGEEIVQKYFGDKNGNNSIPESYRWGYYLYLFVNRTDTAYDSGGTNNVNCLVIGEDWGSKHEYWKKKDGVYDKSKSFRDYGKPEYWRPWWTKGACDLPMTINSQGGLPIDWKKISLSGGTIKDADNSSIVYDPSSWYQWYTAPKSDQLLAWRDGGITGRIVHHVYRDNMKLYATYVDAHLQENDPQPDLSKNPYDATNNDVLDLLANNNHASTPLNFTIDRKFVGGMYNTVCFPFDIPISKLPDELKNADIRVFSGVSENNESGETEMVLNFITLQEYWVGKDNYFGEPYMEAGVPYLIKPDVDVNADYLTYSGLLYWYFFNSSKVPHKHTFKNVTFRGVLNPTDLPENAYILVANNRLAKVTDGNEKMKGFRGYFTWDDPVRMPPAKISISVGKQVTTDVEEIVDDQIIQPTAPKVRKVMYDGQIYILRGEEVYTITGHRVK